MNMKLSYRDKVIFIVAIVIIIIVAGIFVVIKPKFQEIDEAKYKLQEKQTERDEIDAKIATLPVIIDDIKAMAEEIGEKQEIFLTEQDPYLNETYIREAIPNVDISRMSTSYAFAEEDDPLNRYVVTPANIIAYDNKMSADLYNELPQEIYDLYNDVPPEEYPGVVIGTTNMEFTIKSDLALRDAYNVIDRIAEDEKTIILNTVSTDTKEVDGEVTTRDVTYNITMYSIFPLNVEQVLQETDEIKPIEQPAE